MGTPVIMIPSCDKHGGVLASAPWGSAHIVDGAVRVQVSKILCLVWVPIVACPGMPCGRWGQEPDQAACQQSSSKRHILRFPTGGRSAPSRP